jgi:hypothetical protein
MPHKWTLPEIELLRVLWPDTETKTVAASIGRSEQSVWRKATMMKFERTAEFIEKQKQMFAETLRREGVKSRFVKGHISANKGLKLKDYMSPEKIEKLKATQFKSKHKPHNTVEIGHRRIGKDGYLEEKVRDSYKGKNFEFVHHLVYEKHFGSIPDGCLVTFKDGNLLNFEPDNLILKTKKENLLDNQISDSCLIKRMTKEKDPAKIEVIKHEAKELIQVKRATVLLNRKIKENVKSRRKS